MLEYDTNGYEPDEIVRSRKKKQRNLDDTYRDNLKTVLATKAGRAVYWKLLKHCNIFDSTFRGEYHAHTAFEEGKRAIGLQMWSDIFKLDKNLYALMETEATEREKHGG